MSTVPATVTPSVVSSYLKDHERIIITIVVALVLVFGYSKAVSYLAARDQINSTKEQAILQAQLDANKETAAQSQQLTLQYQQLVTQLTAANVQIATAQSQRAQATQQQQTIDRTLLPADLSSRWEALLKLAPGSVAPTPSGYALAPSAAIDTVVQLETIPMLQADLTGQQTITANQVKQIDSLNEVVTSQQTQIVGLGTQIQDQTKACTTQIKTVKAEARKSKLKWFVAGVVTGLVGGHWL